MTMLQEALYFTDPFKEPTGYSPALRIGDFIYISGQLPLDMKTGHLVGSTVGEQVIQVLCNISTLLEQYELDLSYLMRMTVYLTEPEDFETLKAMLQTHFCKPCPSISVIGAAWLPYGARVQIDGFAFDVRALEVLCAKESCSDDACRWEN